MTLARPCPACGDDLQLEGRFFPCDRCRARFFIPNPGPQRAFLDYYGFDAMYGGAAGGGKTASQVIAATQFVTPENIQAIATARRGLPGEPWWDTVNPQLAAANYRAIILRKEQKYLEPVIDEAKALIRVLFPEDADGFVGGNTPMWRFRSGALLYFGHMAKPGDHESYDSYQLDYAGYDEAHHFLPHELMYLQTRLRSPSGLPKRYRLSMNPPLREDTRDWVLKRYGPWIMRDPAYAGPRARPGRVLYTISDGDSERFVPKGTVDGHGSPARPRVFFPSLVTDNPAMLATNSEYQSTLNAMDPLNRARLLHGDFFARQPGRGDYFKREWFKWADRVPERVKSVRYWDLAGSEKNRADYSASVLISRAFDGLFYVRHVFRMRGTPGDVESKVAAFCDSDPRGTVCVIEQEGGQSGLYQRDAYAKRLAGKPHKFVRPTGDKEVRASVASPLVQAGMVHVVREAGESPLWWEPFITELEAFPEFDHDDQEDAFSGAIAELSVMGVPSGTQKLGMTGPARPDWNW